MNDYLKIFDKFKDVEEMKDLIDDVNKVRSYFATQQYHEMKEYINSLTLKYFTETIIWNKVNPEMPTNDVQWYINAENFLAMQGAKILVKYVVNYKQKLNDAEIAFIEGVIRILE